MKMLSCLLLVTAARLAAQVTVEPAASDVPQQAVFGGDEAVLRIKAPSAVSVVYDLFQIGGTTLAAPLASNQPAANIPKGNAQSQIVEVRVPVPEVKRPTRMLVQFRIADAPPSRDLSHSQALLDVFPRPAPGEWRDALAAAGERADRRLAVFGQSPRIRGFFENHAIAFQDLGPDFPETFPSDVVAVGEVSSEALENRRPEPDAGRQLFFVDDAFMLPGVYEYRSPNGAITKVTLSIPAELASNPKAQTIFLDLLHRNLEPVTP